MLSVNSAALFLIGQHPAPVRVLEVGLVRLLVQIAKHPTESYTPHKFFVYPEQLQELGEGMDLKELVRQMIQHEGAHWVLMRHDWQCWFYRKVRAPDGNSDIYQQRLAVQSRGSWSLVSDWQYTARLPAAHQDIGTIEQ